jgi:hypothetical protein
MPGEVGEVGEGEDSSITYAEIHSELEEVRRILVEVTRTVERLSSTVASVNPRQRGSAPTAAMVSPAGQTEPSPTQSTASSPEAVTATSPSSPAVAPNPVDAILGDTFGRPT